MSKILLVTGASSEIGTALIQKIEPMYDVIYAHYNNTLKNVDELKKKYGDKIIPVQADFSDAGEVRKMIATIRESGCIPNNIVHLPATKIMNQKFHKQQWNDYEEGIQVSLHSIVEILEAFIPHMSKEKYGRVVLMLTSCTLNMPPKYQTSYVTVKYALLGLMKSLAVEYADKGITVNGVSPDMVETKFLANVPELIVEQNAQRNPLKRNILISDIVPIIEYLLSDSAVAVTGQNIGVTGGL